MELIKNWLHDFLADRIRILLTIFSVALGTASILLMLAMGEGLRLKLFSMMDAGGVDIITLRGGATEKDFLGFGKERAIELTSKDFDIISNQLNGIADVFAKYRTSTSVQANKKTSIEDIAGAAGNYFVTRKMNVFPGGHIFNDIDQKQSRHVVILGQGIAMYYFSSFEKAVGKSVSINNNLYTVIGVLIPQFAIGGTDRSPEHTLWIPVETFKKSFNPEFVSSINIKPKNPELIEMIKTRVRIALARDHHASPDDISIVKFHDSYAMQEKISIFMWAMELFLGVIGGLTLAVAGVGVSNIMYLTVKESVAQIGLRMAIGARVHHILIYYLIEAFVATLLGGVIGTLIGYGLIELIGYWLSHQSTQFVGLIHDLKPVASFLVVEMVVFVLIIVGLLAGWFPARHAASLSPADALR